MPASWLLIILTIAFSVAAPAQSGAVLTQDEAQLLRFMREEEKLAHDVNQEMFAKWRMRIFSNISQSETRHFSAIGVLLTRYGVDDPARGLPAGVYINPDLAALYKQLIQKGNLSFKDALEVGVLIEKTDIADLKRTTQSTDKTGIKTVYTNLMAGSLNHLDAF
jgi:hypothetical protein